MPSQFSQSANLNTVLIEVAVERGRQDAKWGGPKHDDKHSAYDWTRFIKRYSHRAEQSLVDGLTQVGCDGTANYESHLIAIAALAIAAIQSSRRKRNA